MRKSKAEVLFALKGVIYSPKKESIVNLNMVREIKTEENSISFSIFFPTSDENPDNTIIEACKKAISENLGEEITVNINREISEEIEEKKSLFGVKHIIGVASGKGGVGKSTVSVNLALALAKTGASVGLLDADIYGPSIPIMLGLEDGQPEIVRKGEKDIIMPIEKYGIKILSIGFFVNSEQALIWRGPMAANALKQLFNNADWGALDYLVLDLPPGTGDIHLTLVQELSLTGVAVISTPQEVALADVKKAIHMFNQEDINIPILGLVENMSYFSPPEFPDNRYYIFGKEGCKLLAEKTNIPLLAEIPIVEAIGLSGDSGTPIVLQNDHPAAKAFDALAENIIEKIADL